jgi:hypothetical protein
MAWRIAESLKTLRSQINAAYPNRDKSSDGAIGDAAHASRNSDHNPWVKDKHGVGVVTAIDIDEDLAPDIHSIEAIVSAIRKSKDPRVKYIIYEKRITVAGSNLQKWKAYTGKNPHNHHAHISVNSDPKLYDSTKAWVLDLPKISAANSPTPAPDNLASTEALSASSEALPDNSQVDGSAPSIITQEADQIINTGDMGQNQQDINKPAKVEEAKPYNDIGLKQTLINDAKPLLPSNGIFQFLSDYAQQATGWPPWVIALIGKAALILLIVTVAWLLYRLIAWLVWTWKENERVKLLAQINSDPTRKDLHLTPTAQ